jgi:hypothetical protein
MTAAHFFYIPAVVLVGIVIGYKMGLGAMRKEYERRKKRGEDI